ncbi:DNA internalization-related competence protein ComEC/Rec2 [Carnobacteriaceae bacterium zg-ZUI252]|nr:DNA internalization-related competence protein ComEC/Rec2 [Carnobacteriaceae bacterium zg-ZUI252]
MNTVLLIVTAILTVWTWSYCQWYCLLLALLWCVRLLKLPKGKYQHIIVCVFISLSFVVMPKQSRLDKQQHQFQATVNARDISVNGDALRLSLMIDGEVVTGNYRLSSEREQQFYQQNVSDLKVNVTGQLQEIEPARSPYLFDYKRYAYQQKRQFYQLHIQTINIVDTQSNFIAVLQSHILKNVPSTLYRWINVLFFGGQWDVDMQSGLEQLGVLWLLSLSGFHIQYVLQVFRRLCHRIGITKSTTQKLSIALSALFITFAPHKLAVWKVFWQTGFQKWFDWIVCLYIVLNPYIIYTLAFQLSFGTSLLRRFEKANVIIPLYIALVLSGHYYQFFYASYVFIPVVMFALNYMILPSLLFGIFCGVLSWHFPLLNGLNSLLQSLENVFVMMSNGHAFTLNTGRYHDVVYILLFTMGIIMAVKWSGLKRYVRVGLMILAFFLVVPKPVTRIVMIDVGQGDSFLIQKGYKTVLIDTGGQLYFQKEKWREMKQVSQFDRKVAPMLKGFGIQKIDAVILSHADIDHCGNLDAVKKNFFVEHIIFGKGASIDGDMAITGGQTLKIGDIILNVLYPLKAGKGKNEDSLIIYTVIDRQSLLFTGDAIVKNEEELLQLYPNLTVDVLKVGHHGSKTSTGQAFLERLKPKIALISAGKNNRYGHPNKEVLERLSECTIYRTDQQGSVVFEFGKWTGFLSD